jgi:hypothetical protein
MIDGAEQQWAVEHLAKANTPVTWNDITPYLPWFENLRCPQGGTYVLTTVYEAPRCSIMHHNLEFGYVGVRDEAGNPITRAQVTLRSGDAEICHAGTTTEGLAHLEMYDYAITNSWSNSTTRMMAAKEGYESESVSLPTNSWPLKFVLKKKAE